MNDGRPYRGVIDGINMQRTGKMTVRLTAGGVELSPELKDFVHRRARFSLGRLSAKIDLLTARLADINGPRGGFDKCSSRNARARESARNKMRLSR